MNRLQATLFQYFLHFLLYLSFNGFSVSSSVVHFKMIHRHSPELLNEKPLTRSDRIKDLFQVDKARMEIISHKINLRRGTISSKRRRAAQLQGGGPDNDNSSFSLPILSGSYAQRASYFVTFRIGTPAQKFLLVADTGSDLLWVNCNTKDDNKDETKRIFHPEHSRTFRTVPCSGRLCREGLSSLMSTNVCPTPKSPCTYTYSYVTDGEAQGFFAYDSATVTLSNGQKKKLRDILIGCTQEWTGEDDADGILGLSYSSKVFVSTILNEFQGKFSYCLVDHLSPKHVFNYLTFGHRSYEEMPPNMQFTPLGLIGDWYAISVVAIYVDGVKLNIPAESWNIETGGGMILDNGYSKTAWVEEAYVPIMAALDKALLRWFPRAKSMDFNSCFFVPNVDAKGRYIPMDESLVPKLEIEFMSGARLKPPVKSYLLDANEDNVKCIAFDLAPPRDEYGTYVSILGNIMQQNHMWEFNVDQNRLGFAPSSCELRHHHRF